MEKNYNNQISILINDEDRVKRQIQFDQEAFKSGKIKVYLADEEGKRLTPIVDEIQYDVEKKMFVLGKNISIGNEVSCMFYFCTTINGEPLGGYTTLFGDIMEVKYDEKTVFAFEEEGITIHNVEDELKRKLWKEFQQDKDEFSQEIRGKILKMHHEIGRDK